MFRFLELELHGWDFWQPLRIPLDASVVVLSGPNGAGKTTMLDAIRQILHAGRLSQNRRISHYLRRPNEPALLRAVVSNRADQRGKRPFERQQVFTDEATLACALVPNGGSPEKRFAVLPGRVTPQELQKHLLDNREWLQPEQYRRVLENAGVSRSLMHILALEQGRADELSRQKPRELFRWVMEARGSQQVLDRYTNARRQYEESTREVDRQNGQVLRCETQLAELERKIRRLDEYLERKARVKDAEDIKRAAPLQVSLTEVNEIEKKLPELRTRAAALATTVDRLQGEVESERVMVENRRTERQTKTEFERETRNECDEALKTHTLLQANVKKLKEESFEFASIPAEDILQLERELADSRTEYFRAEQLRSQRASILEEIAKTTSDLEKGVRRYPTSVQETLEALTHAGINAFLIAERLEIPDPSWTTAIESALDKLRYAICVDAHEEVQATEIARNHAFLGPIVSAIEALAGLTTIGPLQFTNSVPKWIIEWAKDVHLVDSGEIANGARGIALDGTRRDIYGVWVSQSPDRVLGGSAIRHQLEQGRQESARTTKEVVAAEEAVQLGATRVEGLELRMARQSRRNELLKELEPLQVLETNLETETAALERKKQEREQARQDLAQAEHAVVDAERLLERKSDDLRNRKGDLEGNRATITDTERRRGVLEDEIKERKSQLDARLIRQAEAGELPPQAMAERELERAQNALATFEAQGEIPPETVREERVILKRNLDDLVRHVQDRQREADAARLELNQCRGDYLNVIRSTLHDYSKRARTLAEMAAAKLEIELPDLHNEDKSLDEAGIVVRIGFDGKAPTELGDTGHSGGQQVIAGLILLMSMAETEGDSFFIVDEPFAHLSLDRVDDVGKFLRRSGAQFLITVPTTLDRGQLDSASLLIVLAKKPADAAYAPNPVVARA